MDINKIAALLSSMPPAVAVHRGFRKNALGEDVLFEIRHGWDVGLANQCDVEWNKKNLEIITFLQKSVCEQDLGREVDKLYMEDAHWRWLGKALGYYTDEYNWFFYVCNDVTQGACLIYHPKDSVMDGQGIFYIEYVAVAPWNRPNPVAPIEFKGVGSELIGFASMFAVEKLGLRPGFSLHSLPKAAAYYQKIGMVCFPERKKGPLEYFEMSKELAQAFGRATNG